MLPSRSAATQSVKVPPTSMPSTYLTEVPPCAGVVAGLPEVHAGRIHCLSEDCHLSTVFCRICRRRDGGLTSAGATLASGRFGSAQRGICLVERPLSPEDPPTGNECLRPVHRHHAGEAVVAGPEDGRKAGRVGRRVTDNLVRVPVLRTAGDL